MHGGSQRGLWKWQAVDSSGTAPKPAAPNLTTAFGKPLAHNLYLHRHPAPRWTATNGRSYLIQRFPLSKFGAHLTMEQLGQYKILRKLGAGAMGEVYLAEHALMRTLYAVKVLPESLVADKGYQERFVSEARVMATLRHPNIVQVHTMDVQGDVHYIVMDFVSPDGRESMTLDDLLRLRGGRLQAEEVGRILGQVCEALIHSHSQGVIHCDIKPANVLLDKKNVVRVSDFGLAKIMGSAFIQQSIAMSLSGSLGASRTIAPNESNLSPGDSLGGGNTLGAQGSSRAESLVGTFHYMPPEVQRGGAWSEQGDVYSLGVLMYVLLTGELPLGRWKLPSQLASDIDTRWDTITERMLEGSPQDRYQRVANVLDALKEPMEKLNQTRAEKTTVSASNRITIHSGSIETSSVSDTLPSAGKALIHQFIQTKNGQYTDGDVLDLMVKMYQVPGCAEIPREGIAIMLKEAATDWQAERPRREKERQEEEERKQRELHARGIVCAEEEFAVIDLDDSIALALLWVSPGEFLMGSPKTEIGKGDNEKQHRVILTQGFWMGLYPVTQLQWQTVMGNNPSHFQTTSGFLGLKKTTIPDLPVETVSWNDCQAFIKKMNLRGEGTFRLPTEAEWEYACRAGGTDRYCFGNEEGRLGDYAWYDANSRGKTHPVGQKQANTLGLYDMHGNVWEWCQDWYGDYPGSAQTDPTGPGSGKYRVLRGGSWNSNSQRCRSAYRLNSTPDYRDDLLGFRVVRTQ